MSGMASGSGTGCNQPGLASAKGTAPPDEVYPGSRCEEFRYRYGPWSNCGLVELKASVSATYGIEKLRADLQHPDLGDMVHTVEKQSTKASQNNHGAHCSPYNLKVFVRRADGSKSNRFLKIAF